MGRLRFVNEIGIGLKGAEKDRVQDLRVYEENGSVQVWIETKDEMEIMQYLTAQEAMCFAHAFEQCAIKALKEQSKFYV